MIVEVEHIHHSYGDFTALKDVSFSIGESEIVGLLGPNGAGKTTTILSLLGLLSPQSGTIKIFGLDFKSHRQAILAGINLCSPYLAFPGRLTVYENLMVFAHLYQLKKPVQRVMEALEIFEIQALKNTPVLRLSSGQNTKVGLCKALLNKPRLLILDEPTAFLDPQASRIVQTALSALQKQGTAILYTTHNMADAEELCDRVVLLAKGSVRAIGTPLEVTQALLGNQHMLPDLKDAFLKLAALSP